MGWPPIVYSRRMTSKDLLIHIISESVEQLFKYAKAVPPDKVSWSAGGDARTTLDICQECVQAPKWTIDMLETRSVGGDFSDDAWAAIMAERQQWDTVDKCEAEANLRTAKLIETIKAFPDAEMSDTLFLPFTGKDHPYWDIMLYPYWNNTWHTGQIAFIQRLLGDKQMY